MCIGWVRYPVTNADFGAFLRRTGYTPADTEHWLQHWDWPETQLGQSTVQPVTPTAIAKQPVTYVSERCLALTAEYTTCILACYTCN